MLLKGRAMPKVSVIIPCYNQENYLKDAIESLKGDYTDYEVIVINDGSTNPNAQDVIESVCKSGIKLINQANQGVCFSRNNGIDIAQGEYILPLDADDKIDNRYLKEAVDILDNNPDIGIITCDAEFFGERSGLVNLKEPAVFNMLSQNQIHNTSMFRKSDWLKVGGYKEEFFEGCEDWDFWLSLIEAGVGVYKINKVYFWYRKHIVSRTNRALEFNNYCSIRRKIVRNHKNLYSKHIFAIILLALRVVKKGLLCLV